MTKLSLQAVTPVGTFTRATDTPYTRIVVWRSERAAKALADNRTGGVAGRWAKDLGYGVTWHSSERTAQNASASYKWDGAATLVGVFAVTQAAVPLLPAPTLLQMVLDDCDVLNPDGSARPLSEDLLAKIRAVMGGICTPSQSSG